MKNDSFQNMRLSPDIKWLKKDYVLIQAWKKAQQYIRNHNWYADTLELDISTIRLPFLMKEWASIDHKNFHPSEIRIVPAPKANILKYIPEEGWKDKTNARLRPLAHVSIKEQTLAVACMMCLAEIVESHQGNTDQDNKSLKKHGIVNYGNRLYCKWKGNQARFRWANTDCYSKFYQDYRRFIRRPAHWQKILGNEQKNWIEVQVDLSQFYDRVGTKLLHKKTESLLSRYADTEYKEFFSFFKRLFSWRWDVESIKTIESCKNLELKPEKPIALPQGLVASGFFANIVLFDFDYAISKLIGKRIRKTKWVLHDYCRYVDDMRFTLVADKTVSSQPSDQFIELINNLLSLNASGLIINKKKSSFIYSWQTENKIPVSRTMEHVQSRISGPMDIKTVWETTETLQGLLDITTINKDQVSDDMIRLVKLKPDVRDDTISRFAAHRLKKTLRLARILSYDDVEKYISKEITKAEVDAKMDIIARKLIAKFIEDPSNIRLLSIAFDICPNQQLCEKILELIKNHLKNSRMIRLVCYYCIAEIYRAGATQIGFVYDLSELPHGENVNINHFRETLSSNAKILLEEFTLPWYVQQQLLLYLALQNKYIYNLESNDHYSSLHSILHDSNIYDSLNCSEDDDALNTFSLLLLGYHIQGDKTKYAKSFCRLMGQLSSSDKLDYYISTIMSECSELGGMIWKYSKGTTRDLVSIYRKVPKRKTLQPPISLLEKSNQMPNPFRHEVGLLRFVAAVLKKWSSLESSIDNISSSNLVLNFSDSDAISDPRKECDLSITLQSGKPDQRFLKPNWLPDTLSWKRTIGLLMRSAITGEDDSTYRFIGPKQKLIKQRYYGIRSTWYRRQFGMFMGRSWLGSPDIPISPWITELISRLLAWPGQEVYGSFNIYFETFNEFENIVNKRLKKLNQTYGKHSSLPINEFPIVIQPQSDKFKIAIVQTVLPSISELSTSPKISHHSIRHKQRNHFMTVLNCIDTMFRARKTHADNVIDSKYVDLIVLPELSIHPDDIFYLSQLAINYKCIIFGGLIYHDHPLNPRKLVNEGIWIIPYQQNDTWTREIILQGKNDLAKAEQSINRLEGYRPCQWIIDINRNNIESFKITASICYDATDIRLAADLRDVSDCYIISALNKDVDLFDNMATALRYHMYQHIIISNSGEYGGSTAQAPFEQRYERTIIHSHGANQISIKFLEIPFMSLRTNECKKYKTPPAGITVNQNPCYGCGKCMSED